MTASLKPFGNSTVPAGTEAPPAPRKQRPYGSTNLQQYLVNSTVGQQDRGEDTECRFRANLTLLGQKHLVFELYVYCGIAGFKEELNTIPMNEPPKIVPADRFQLTP